MPHVRNGMSSIGRACSLSLIEHETRAYRSHLGYFENSGNIVFSYYKLDSIRHPAKSIQT